MTTVSTMVFTKIRMATWPMSRLFQRVCGVLSRSSVPVLPMPLFCMKHSSPFLGWYFPDSYGGERVCRGGAHHLTVIRSSGPDLRECECAM
ncbi:hypothetical protein [Streptomyces sp. NEAU-YJ-81]|uniref:hypothetical protein n=1 Tax=Streptomyces sp. NEAU-YJ-81 TaxID=2820288 RepID=UPI001ABC3168|nr:hypothetical protein [Streptomyces sp. NEAU-YJ-81]MBO3676307.1 hypothetical protein [Streptomyces sp. NEAU-YJ-81]